MAQTKTKPTQISVESFTDAVENPTRAADARTVCAMMERITGHEPKMWGPSIIGYSSYHYKYDSGHEGTMCRLGFSPRKAQLVLYALPDYMEGDEEAKRQADGEAELLLRLGKHKTGKCCLYINKLADVDMEVLEELTTHAWDWMNRRYPN